MRERERMELGRKIQKLRLERSYTQEQFARKLFVSRTAVSKWETGRGTPNIESLKMIAQEFGITLDELLRADEAIEACENEHRENVERMHFRMDAIVNASSLLALALPLYKAEADGGFVSVPIYAFEGRFALIFWLIPALLTACAGMQLLTRSGKIISLIGNIVNALAVFLFILNGQPYPAALYFSYIIIKIVIPKKTGMIRKEPRM